MNINKIVFQNIPHAMIAFCILIIISIFKNIWHPVTLQIWYLSQQCTIFFKISAFNINLTKNRHLFDCFTIL